MNESDKNSCRHGDCVIQDGVACPTASPWKRHVGILTGIPLAVMTILAVYILGKTSLAAMALWLGLLLVFALPLRYLVCARCPYYGQPCSTVIGTLIPRIMKKQEGKSMLAGLWFDVLFFVALFMIPLPLAWQRWGWPMALLWINVTLLVFATITRFGCTRCPLTFCPIGKVGRAFWIIK